MSQYNYKNCKSLFGYSASVHIRSRGKCQLCGCGGLPIDFNLWRQLTVEHLIGKSQGGYLKQIRAAVTARFPEFSIEDCESLSKRIDELNTVTACSFCNSTTSRDINQKNMDEILLDAGSFNNVEGYVEGELQLILKRKIKDVKWKLLSVEEAFQREVYSKIIHAGNN